MPATLSCDRVRLRLRHDLRSIREAVRMVRGIEHRLFEQADSPLSPVAAERRSTPRFSGRFPCYVLPVTWHGFSYVITDAHAEPFLAFTKDIALRGIGFVHEQALDANYVIVTVDLFDRGCISLLTEMRWSTECDPASYMSGGRFVALTDTPTPQS